MSKWKRIDDERRGMLKGKVWLTNGKDRALFKPEGLDNDCKMEVEVSRIAAAIGIPCAKVEPFTYWFKKGCLSYNFKEQEYAYRPANKMYMKSGVVTNKSRDSKGNSLLNVDIVSMQTIRANEVFKPLEKGAVDMLFLDCLVNNADRHGGNWEIQLTPKGDIVGVAPLFDHGLCVWDKNNPDRAKSKVLWAVDDKPEQVTHFYMFRKLCENYTQQVGELLDKCRDVKLNDFCSERLDEMRKIYETEKLPEQAVQSENIAQSVGLDNETETYNQKH